MSNILLTNLKVIGKIPENGRIKRTNNGIFTIIEPYQRFLWITRFFSGDSRKTAVSDIESLIDETIDKCTDILNSKIFRDHKNFDINNSYLLDHITEEYNQKLSTLLEIKDSLEPFINGLKNLKNTYYSDVTTTSKIDLILSKIKNLKDLLSKVK